MVREGGVGAAYPVEGYVLKGMGCRLNQETHYTDTQGTSKELDVKAAAPSLRIVLNQDYSRDTMRSRSTCTKFE